MMENVYIYIFSLAAVVAIASAISYDGERASYMRFLLGAVLVSGICLPVLNFVRDFSLSDYTVDVGEGDASAVSRETLAASFCDAIERAVAEEFSLDSESVSVTCRGFDLGTCSAEKITVLLTGSAALSDIRGIRNFCEEISSADAEVKIVRATQSEEEASKNG